MRTELPDMDQEEQKPDISSLRIEKSRKYDDRPKSRGWRWIVLLVIVAACVIGYFLLKESVTPATKVKVTRVTMTTGSDAAAELVATGYVVAQRLAEVASKGTGRLAYLGYEEGDTVTSGEIIARLDNRDVAANLDLARAALRQAEVDTLNAGRTFRRAAILFESGSIPDVDLESAEAAYQTALAGLEGAVASVKMAEVDLENTYIRAPFSGTILTKNAEVGEMVAPFASSQSSKGSVVTLADMNSLEVEADVSEANIYKVAVGQPCEIILDAYPSLRYVARVKKIVPTADRARSTVLTRVAFDRIDSRVLPQMSARINFFVADNQPAFEEPQALTVNRDALTTRDGVKVVFLVEDNHVTEAAVTTGRELGDVVEILNGLTAGQLAVLNPPGKMQSGQKVEITR
jgi:RND family efflux transporter MFP subunit